MSLLGRVRALVSDEIRFILLTHLLNFLTTNHPMNLNQIECHEHALSSTRRHTFNRNVVKLLDFVLERHNPCTMTVNVVVLQHNFLAKLAVNNTSHRRRQQPLWRTRRTFNIMEWDRYRVSLILPEGPSSCDVHQGGATTAPAQVRWPPNCWWRGILLPQVFPLTTHRRVQGITTTYPTMFVTTAAV